uniref:THAP domain containing 6 n=1 Tax=Chrysemys picta bellii TaxID=8478 RepID=A0A8C3HI92_CHRPI
MVKSCSAVGCASRCLPNSKLRGLTFHVFPTDEEAKRRWVLATKRLDVNSAGMWEPKKADVLCSRHFKKSDFDTRGPNIRLKPGVIPSIFEFPSHFQVGLYNLQVIVPIFNCIGKHGQAFPCTLHRTQKMFSSFGLSPGNRRRGGKILCPKISIFLGLFGLSVLRQFCLSKEWRIRPLKAFF